MKKCNVVLFVVACFMSLLVFVYDLEITYASDNEEYTQDFFEHSNLLSSPLMNEEQSGIDIKNKNDNAYIINPICEDKCDSMVKSFYK